MDIALLVTTARDSYVLQFLAFAESQQSKCDRGAPEVKMEIGGTSGLFEKLYCADFVINDNQMHVVELASDEELSFDPVESEYGSVSLRVRNLQWDDVTLRHDLDALPQAQLKHWFDLDDRRYKKGPQISRIMHSLLVQPRMLRIDFGTAEPAAFWDILDLLKDAGASSIDISSSRAQAERG